MSTIVNRRDLDFLLYETLKIESLFEQERYADYDRESIDAIIDLAQSLAEEQFQPFAAHLCLLYTSPSPRDLSTSRMPSSA